MARIRSIKPETPHSETLGRCSRDARLCFIMLWTQADDAGRLRGNSRMLASLLFPYDDDAPNLMGEWLDELDREGCIRRYVVNGNAYVDIPNWLEHQKIDKPSKSKLPAFDEASRIIAKPREPSALEGKGKEGTKEGKGGEIEPPSAGADAPPIEPAPFALPVIADRGDEGEAVRMWNDLAAHLSLPRVQKLTRAREAALRKRLADCGGLKGWAAALEKVGANPWMHGANKRGWKADFDFLVQEKSFTRLMEGSYDHTPDQKPGNGFAAILAEAEQISRGCNFGPGESELQPGV